MNKLTQYKAVFFDAADTLLTIRDTDILLQRHLQAKSFAVSVEQAKAAIQATMRKFYIEKETDTAATCSPESDRRFWVELYRHALGMLGADQVWSAAEIERCSHELYELFMSPEHYVIFSDVKEGLDKLQEQGYRLGLVSNFSLSLRDILAKHGIAEYFNPLIISTEVGFEKPNPQIFRLALKEAGLEPHEVLYVGDHEINDIWAPAQAGIDAVRIKRYPDQQGEGISSLLELLKEE